MDKWIELLNGKKTYITAAIIGVQAVLLAMGYVIPDWVYSLEAAAGLGSLRVAVSKV